MQFTTATIFTLLAAVASAAPAPSNKAAPANAVSMMADAAEWTIRNFKRTCDAADTSCAYEFGIDAGTGNGTVVQCSYTVTAESKASRAPDTGAKCGAYTVSSSWSGQFGEDKGFTTLAVVDNVNRLIVWPAYTDKQLANGVVVKPDQSYAPVKLA